MADHGRHTRRARHSLRRRVALVFAAAVAVSALALALSAYFITKTAQDEEALDKALAQSRFNLFLADAMLPIDSVEADYNRLLDALRIRGDFLTLIETGSEIYFSDLSGSETARRLISAELAEKVAEGRLGYQLVTMNDEPTIAVGGQVRSADTTFYFFYPQGARLASLVTLRDVLIVGGLVLAFLGAVAGYWLARRLLGPVRAASRAAALMSRGDLDIRLPGGTDEFGILADSFNRMADNLQAKMLDLEAGQARERRFVADVTHELRTPVAALVGEASLLKSRLESTPDDFDPEVGRLASLVTSDIARLRQLVDDLLEISRLDARAEETVMEPVDLGVFLPQLVEAHGWTDTVPVVSEPPDGGPGGAARDGSELTHPGVARLDLQVQTDKRRVERIVVNLVENALRHGASPVEIRVRRIDYPPGPDGPVGGVAETGTIHVVVTDSGPGIPTDHLEHVFDRFYKADPSRSASPGSGLGLAIARENARLIGGDLTVANAPGGGARFVLELPAF